MTSAHTSLACPDGGPSDAAAQLRRLGLEGAGHARHDPGPRRGAAPGSGAAGAQPWEA